MSSEGSVPSRSASAASTSAWWPVVEAHGRTWTAFRALGADLTVWSPRAAATAACIDDGAVVAYATVPRAAVAAGEPIAAESALVDVAEAFVAAQRGAGRRACFFGTEGRLARSPQLARRLLGEQPVWDPRGWDAHVRGHRSLREQLRRARAKGVRVMALDVAALDVAEWRRAIDTLVERWRATRSMATMEFLVRFDLTHDRAQRRLFVAMQHDQLVGLVALAPVPARRGWLLEHVLRDPDAPNGTAELLVDHTMRALAVDDVPWATLGLAPLHGDVDAGFARIRLLARPLFNFAGLASFKRKLQPDAWEPIYLAWPRTGSGWRALLDGLRAFAGGRLWRFAVRTLLRGPAPVLQALEALLVPWTLLLALLPVSPWFPSRVVQGAWVVFDVMLLGALITLRHHSTRRGARARRRAAQLGVAVAIAVSLDAVLTTMEALWWRAPWDTGVVGRVGTLMACVGPAVAAAMLWGTARRARVLARPRPPVDAHDRASSACLTVAPSAPVAAVTVTFDT